MALGVATAAAEEQPRDPLRDLAGGTSTAWMLPAGGWAVSSMIIAARFAAAPHERVQVELMGFLPSPVVNAAGAAVGAALLAGDGARLVMKADAGFGIDHKASDGLRPGVRSFVVRRRAWTAGASLIGSACADERCRAAGTLGVRGGWAEVDGTGYLESSLFGSATARLGPVTLYAHGELETCHRRAVCYDLAGRYGGGVRRAWERWALDVGWARRIDDKDQPHIVLGDLSRFGSPWFSLTYFRH